MSEIIYGINTIYSIIINKSYIIKEFYIIDNFKYNFRINKIIYELKNKNILIKKISKKDMNKITNTKKHQNIFIITKNILNIKLNKIKNSDLINKKMILILENIKDPRNLGSCLRSASAANVDCVIITKYNSCPINEIVRKVACGAVDNLLIYTINNIKNILFILKKNNIEIIGTSEKSNNSIYEFNFKYPLAIIFGSEDNGIRFITKKYCDKILKIPTFGKINSLNVSVTVGIFLFEIIRQCLKNEK